LAPARGWTATKLSGALLSGLFLAALVAGMGVNALFASPSVLLDYYAPGAPGAPLSASAAPGNASATLHWHIPSTNGGSPIVGYVVTPYDGFVPLAAQSFPATPTTQLITGLTNAQTYIFKVAAVNGSGLGPQSVASNAVKVGSPGTPTISTVIPGKNQVTLKLTAPTATNGSPITGYVVTPFVGGVAQTIRVLNSAATTGVVGGLTDGRSYTFGVAARNKNGTGLMSAASASVVVAGAPGAPTDVQAARVAAGTLRVSFVAGATNGLPITSFTATCSSGKAGGVTATNRATTGPITVTDLTPKKSYRCSVTATNARGTGPPSRRSPPVTP
jgi:hypothetical protein